jgi:hypothetical protein
MRPLGTSIVFFPSLLSPMGGGRTHDVPLILCWCVIEDRRGQKKRKKKGIHIIKVSDCAGWFICSMQGKSDSASCHHFLAQVVLVFTDRAVPSADGLVFAHHDVFSDFVEKTGKELVSIHISTSPKGCLPEVVRHHDNTAVEGVDGIGQAVDGGDIETVGRLVQEQHVRRFDSQEGEDDTALLTF